MRCVPKTPHTLLVSSEPHDRFGRGGGEDFFWDAGVEAEFDGIDEALQHRGDEVFDGASTRQSSCWETRSPRQTPGREVPDTQHLSAVVTTIRIEHHQRVLGRE